MNDQAEGRGNSGIVNLLILIAFLIGALIILKWVLAVTAWLIYTSGGLILVGLILYFLIKVSKKA